MATYEIFSHDYPVDKKREVLTLAVRFQVNEEETQREYIQQVIMPLVDQEAACQTYADDYESGVLAYTPEESVSDGS